MKRLARVIECIGFMSILFGCSAMDSPSITIPLVMTFGGAALMWAGVSMEGGYED